MKAKPGNTFLYAKEEGKAHEEMANLTRPHEPSFLPV